MGKRLATSKQKYLFLLLGILALAGLIALIVYKTYDEKLKHIEHHIQQIDNTNK